MAADGRLEGVHALGLAGRVNPIPERFAKGGAISLGNIRPDTRLLGCNSARCSADLQFRRHRSGARTSPLAGLPSSASRGRLRPGGNRRPPARATSLAAAPRPVRFVDDRGPVAQSRADRSDRAGGSRRARSPTYPTGSTSRGLRRPPATGRASGLTLGTVCALRPEKNLSRLLRVVAALPRHAVDRLVIAGDGPGADRADGNRRRTGSRVEGRIPWPCCAAGKGASVARFVRPDLGHRADAFGPAGGDGHGPARRRHRRRGRPRHASSAAAPLRRRTRRRASLCLEPRALGIERSSWPAVSVPPIGPMSALTSPKTPWSGASRA